MVKCVKSGYTGLHITFTQSYQQMEINVYLIAVQTNFIGTTFQVTRPPQESHRTYKKQKKKDDKK